MGLGMMLVFIGIAYVRTRDPKWRRLAFFWTQIYGLIFAMGVATGIVQPCRSSCGGGEGDGERDCRGAV